MWYIANTKTFPFARTNRIKPIWQTNNSQLQAEANSVNNQHKRFNVGNPRTGRKTHEIAKRSKTIHYKEELQFGEANLNRLKVGTQSPNYTQLANEKKN